jgi:branched-chain amino acid transport system permease protein
VYGAVFMMLIPIFLDRVVESFGTLVAASQLASVQNAVFGLVIILFLIFEPRGLDRIWQRVKDFVRFWPFRY